jgi:hypothetical protein
LHQSKSGLPATASLNTAKAKQTLPIFWLHVQAEDREKASEARQTVIHKIAKKSTKNSISRKKVSPFHSRKPGVIFLLLYAVVDSALCFAT